jgi:transposase
VCGLFSTQHRRAHRISHASQFVKPFVKSKKNDFIDAEAIAEAVDRHNMRFVPIKTDDQLDLQALHRVRDRLMQRRTSVINQIRAFLLERGMVFAKSPIRLREAIPEVLENANENLTPRMRNRVAMLWSEWKDLELQIVEMNDEASRRLVSRYAGTFLPPAAAVCVLRLDDLFSASARSWHEFAPRPQHVPRERLLIWKQQLLPRHPMAEAINYALGQWVRCGFPVIRDQSRPIVCDPDCRLLRHSYQAALPSLIEAYTLPMKARRC